MRADLAAPTALSELLPVSRSLSTVRFLFRRDYNAQTWIYSEVFNQAMANIMPALECKARRVGGATYQVPLEVRPERRQTLALRWLVMFARKRGERNMYERLASEIIDASNNTGNAVKRREDMHKMAEANKAFAHYRW